MLSILTRSYFNVSLEVVSFKNSRWFCSLVNVSKKQFDALGKDFEKRALRLIFDNRSYDQFAPHEKRLVDRYQEWILKEDGGMVLPNTRIDWEQRQVERLSSGKF